MPIIGKDAKLGAGKESTWGTAVAVSEQLPLLSEEISRVINQIENNYLDGNVAIPSLTNTTQEASGSITVEGVYDTIAGDIFGVDTLILGALGSGAYDATSGYSIFKPTTDLNISHSYAVKKGSTITELSGAKIQTLTISGQANGSVQMVAQLLGKQMLITGESGITNTTTTLNGLAPTASPGSIRFDQLSFRLDTLGSALADTDRKCLSAFSLAVNNTLTGASYASKCDDNPNSLLTQEPVRDGRRRVTLSITYPRFDTFTDFTWLTAGTEVQASLTFTDGTSVFEILLPKLRVTNASAPVAGAGLVSKTVEFLALRNNGSNSNMTDAADDAITDEIVIQTKNARTAIPS